jgi:uncharacterized protein YecE (DUF72 family)
MPSGRPRIRSVTVDPAHDPGPEAVRRRAEAVADAAAEPIPAPGGGLIRVGTASWTDPTMTAAGVFYPPGVDTAEERLAYYAGRFPVVEVDATYYALPARRTTSLWVERTPPDFVFDVKAHALLTGQPSEPRRLPKALREALPPELAAKPRLYAKDLPGEVREAVWEAFRDALEPLAAAGQLGAVFLQYPRWFYASAANRDAIVEAAERLSPLPVAVEFRNASWFNERNLERALRFLADGGITLVIVDAPQGLRSSVPPLVAVTSPRLAVVRFHGRRAETWEAPGIPPAERFRYLYERSELEEWVPRIRRAAAEARETHVLMNNCYANYGATNALELAALLLEPERAGEGGD